MCRVLLFSLDIVNRNWRFLRHFGPKLVVKKIRYTFDKHKMNSRVAKDVKETYFFYLLIYRNSYCL